MVPSVVLNAFLVIVNLVCIPIGLKKLGLLGLFRYFTVLSNVLCALCAAVVLIAWTTGALPLWVILLKFVGTVAVSVTLLTVFLYLAPVSGEWKKLLSGPDLFWHLICPLIAIVSLCVFERTDFGFPWVFLGLVPTVLYGVFYLYRVVILPEDRRMEDFYGFNKNGKWLLSVLMILGITLVASVILWAV